MVELDERNFDEVVTDAPGPVLVDFWGRGSGPRAAKERKARERQERKKSGSGWMG